MIAIPGFSDALPLHWESTCAPEIDVIKNNKGIVELGEISRIEIDA
jgi:hypothetical protein